MSGIKINCLTAQDTANGGDMVPIWSASAQDTRRLTVDIITTYVLAALGGSAGMVTQYAAPSASPFSVTVATVNGLAVSVWLVLTPTGTLAVGTIALPPSGTAVDGQEVMINTTQAVTTLTVSATGLTVTGAPTTLAANAAFRMRYDAVTTTWYMVA